MLPDIPKGYLVKDVVPVASVSVLLCLMFILAANYSKLNGSILYMFQISADKELSCQKLFKKHIPAIVVVIFMFSFPTRSNFNDVYTV
jgi:uncharacterized SAM-binding protein YcdF (DUF218 family)